MVYALGGKQTPNFILSTALSELENTESVIVIQKMKGGKILIEGSSEITLCDLAYVASRLQAEFTRLTNENS